MGDRGMNQKLKDFLLLNAGTLLVAAGVYFFKFPNHFSTGGVSGLSILLGEVVPWMSSGAPGLPLCQRLLRHQDRLLLPALFRDHMAP